jgi:ribosome-binding protein aMBF1 (putative translation factor)
LRGEQETVGEQFGRNLSEAREWEGLTQLELAERAAVPVREVVRMEHGHRCPRLDNVVRLADAVQVQVRDLLYGIE